MLKYHLLLFVRNLRRQRMFTLINVLGLTMGIVSSLLIYLYVEHELSYDRFHKNAAHIYRINQTFIWGEDNNQLFASTGPGVAVAVAAELPEVKSVVRAHPPGNLLLTYTDPNNERVSFDQEGILAVDSNFLEVFTFPMVKGDSRTALVDANTMVLTESAARKYFGDADPVGKLIQSGNGEAEDGLEVKTYQVTGVVQDPPSNSYIDFDVLLSMNSYPRVRRSGWSWVWTMFETYVVLHDNASPDAVRAKLAALPPRYAEATLQRAMGTTYADYTRSGKQWNLYLQPLLDIHLRSGNTYNRINDVGNITIVYVLIGIVAFILLLSCVNFMNLSTAQYTRRIKESSLRKIMGSTRWQLSSSFFTEALLFCTVAALLAVMIAQLALPYLNVLSGVHYKLDLLSNSRIVAALVALVLAMSLLSASYPAVFLTAFRPVDALKGKSKSGSEGKMLRNGLVVFQFVVSIVLIVSTLVVVKQLRFLSHKDIGFDRENLVVLDRLEWVNDKETLFHALTAIPGVEQASWCNSVPPNLYDGDGFKAEGDQDLNFNLNYVKADESYVPALGLDVIVGRNFREESPSDVQGVLLNETAARHLGWAVDESIIGKKIYYPGGEDRKFEVLGVVRDFNYWSLQAPIQPMAIFNIRNELSSQRRQFAALRITGESADQWSSILTAIEHHWRAHAGDAPFQYSFVDQAFEASFKGEEKFSQALTVFALLAIAIAALGLLGMVVFTIESRLKEIGIRKVIGASVWNILVLIARNYARLIALALLVSIPLTIWLMTNWLSGFEYRINLSADVFIIAGLSTFAVAIMITSVHSIRAALTNPVDVLKDE